MANGVLIGPLPLGDSFVNITCERSSEVVHHYCAPLPPKPAAEPAFKRARAPAKPAAKEDAAERV